MLSRVPRIRQVSLTEADFRFLVNRAGTLCENQMVELQKLHDKRHCCMWHASHLSVLRRMIDIAAAPRTENIQSQKKYTHHSSYCTVVPGISMFRRCKERFDIPGEY